MAEPIRQSYQIIQIIQIMNQLHRLTVNGDFPCQDSGMSVSQLACIGFRAYEEGRPVYQRDLEECFKLRRSTISSILTTLEKKDLIQRVPVTHDARLKRLVLTRSGKALGDQVKDHFAALNDVMVADLDEKEKDTLSRILEKVDRSLARRCP